MDMEWCNFLKLRRKKLNMRDNGSWVKCMAKESSNGEMDLAMKENIFMGKSKDLGNLLLHPLKLAMKVLGPTENKMEQE